ncbi:preprotein translocase subunit SecA [Natronospirillum operosum]|uniref:Protein translocase subunit SecA n=1 Tax=Natronospirillum operosum TaxID=2759953 RepID=A0A4Z0W979_9GAMM|nr:preprotein translocase subunit SecA [Natronospirillum operosum]TGG92733.1 preprotein translocase subunit SecA [Natronospirillum operosum]
MFTQLAKLIVGSKNEREVKRLRKTVHKINALEEGLQALSDADLQARTPELKKRLAEGATLEDLLPEAFAVCREASRRVMGMRHFDVQLIGGMVLHQGKVAEMKTGEGKTLVATLPVYLNALDGEGVHLVTVNDYLAARDADWMRPLYEFLGLTVGVVRSQQPPEEKRAAYQADVTYGTNNEMGFDYLRDNMAFRPEDRYQRGHVFAIVDEVDSILIDEARTPLVISGPAEDSSELYTTLNKLVPRLEQQVLDENGEIEKPGDFTVDEKDRLVELTEQGHEHLEQLLIEQELLGEGESLYAPNNLGLLHHATAALRAHNLFHRDVHYLVQDDQVLIVDEHTGRTMPGRRWSEGLHQAVEAKEGLQVQRENQTLASTTFQNYFRLYDKLAGMTGTADTEAFELRQIYGLDVVVIPTNKPIARVDNNDLVYLTEEEKYEAVIADIKTTVEQQRPVLVGTASVEASERISEALNTAGLKHNVLNAKNHANEAQIIAEAGRPGAITIATNMAGRGTDIVLGGNWEAEARQLDNPSEEQVAAIKADWDKRNSAVIEAGGLHIIGTERHESRRIDNQLRGRAGRQGDPGSSRFYLSLEDPFMRIFMSDRMKSMMQNLGMDKGEALEARMVSNAIEKAQRKVENRNFDIRKQLLEYDNVANDQRMVVYAQRNEFMVSEDLTEMLEAIRADVVHDVIDDFIPPGSLHEQWDVSGLQEQIKASFAVDLSLQQWIDADDHLGEQGLRDRILEAIAERYREKSEVAGPEAMRRFEKQVMLQVLDQHWKEHLHQMDQLRQGIHLRGYAQKNPKQEYKKEAFALFQEMLESVKRETIRVLSHVQVRSREEVEEMERKRAEQEKAMRELQRRQSELREQLQAQGQTTPATASAVPKVGRNEPCPCGSGKKYKHCHGRLS